MASRILTRRDTKANWDDVNPLIALGELVVETDTKRFKIGTGADNYKALGYLEGVVSEATMDAAIAANTKVVKLLDIVNAGTFNRYDLKLESLTVKSIDYNTDDLPTTIYYIGDGDDDGTIHYFRATYDYGSDGVTTIKYYYDTTAVGTDDHNGKLTFTYSDGKLSATDYSEQ